MFEKIMTAVNDAPWFVGASVWALGCAVVAAAYFGLLHSAPFLRHFLTLGVSWVYTDGAPLIRAALSWLPSDILTNYRNSLTRSPRHLKDSYA